MRKTDITYLIQQAKRLPRHGQTPGSDDWKDELKKALQGAAEGAGVAILQKTYADLNKTIENTANQFLLLEQRNEKIRLGLRLTLSQAAQFGENLDNIAAQAGLSSKYLRQLTLETEKLAAGYAKLGVDKIVDGKKEYEFANDYTKLLAQQYDLNIQNLALSKDSADNYNRFLAGSFAGVEAAEDFTKQLAGTVSKLEAATGQTNRLARITEVIANSGAEIQMAFAKNPLEISKAILQADRLGMSLKDIKNTSEKFLDVESSISKELELQLLGGKRINTAKFRQAVISQDLNAQTEELTKLIEDNKQELIDNPLFRQEFSTFTGQDADNILKAAQNLQATYNISGKDTEAYRAALDQVQEISKLEMDKVKEKYTVEGTLAKNRYKSEIEFQEGLTNAYPDQVGQVEKVSEAVTNAQTVTSEGITKGAEAINKDLMEKIGGAAAGLIIGKAVVDQAKEYASGELNIKSEAAYIQAQGPVVVAGGSIENAEGGGVQGGSNENDVLSMPTGTSGYGSRILYGPEGAINLNNKDMVVAGTDLLGGNSSNNNATNFNIIIEGNDLSTGFIRNLISRIKIEQNNAMNYG